MRPARVLSDRLDCRPTRLLSTVDRREHRGRDEVRIVDRGELDEPETIGEVQDRPLGHFHRQSGLSAPADTEDAHDAVRAHEAEHRVDLAFAADERCELHGKVGERRIGGQQRLVDEREVGVAELVHALGTLDVLQVVDSHVLEPCTFGQLIGHEVVGGLRQDGLTSVRDRAQPRASDDRGALIGALAGLHLARVQRQPHPERRAADPLPLERERTRERVRRTGERGDEAVALALLERQHAVVRGHALAHHFAEAGHGCAHLVGPRLPKTGRSFDISQEERDGSRGYLLTRPDLPHRPEVWRIAAYLHSVWTSAVLIGPLASKPAGTRRVSRRERLRPA